MSHGSLGALGTLGSPQVTRDTEVAGALRMRGTLSLPLGTFALLGPLETLPSLGHLGHLGHFKWCVTRFTWGTEDMSGVTSKTWTLGALLALGTSGQVTTVAGSR